MKIHDYMLCTFKGDTQNPPLLYAAEIKDINAAAGSFRCQLVDSGLLITFKYTSSAGSWSGTDDSGVNYEIDSHNIYTAGAVSPGPKSAAVITLAGGSKYFCYVSSVDPSTEVQLYGFGSPSLTITDFVVSNSAWDAVPAGTRVSNIEGYVPGDALPVAGGTAVAGTAPLHTAPVGGISTVPDTEQFFFADIYSGDLGGKPDWNALAAAKGFYGAIIKATQGTKGYTNDHGWFQKNWQLLKDAGGDRYGNTWFRGAYLFLNFWQSGADQADNYLDIIDAAGGWGNGDIIPIVDVEMGNDGANGGKRNPNNDSTTQQIIDCTTACADRIRSRTGRNVMLYGRGAMRDRGIKSKMGCDVVWNPAYTSPMVTHGLEAWTVDDIALWQYCGDGEAAMDINKFPRSVAGFGKIDISIYIEGKNKPSFQHMISRLGIGTAG